MQHLHKDFLIALSEALAAIVLTPISSSLKRVRVVSLRGFVTRLFKGAVDLLRHHRSGLTQISIQPAGHIMCLFFFFFRLVIVLLKWRCEPVIEGVHDVRRLSRRPKRDGGGNPAALPCSDTTMGAMTVGNERIALCLWCA